MKFHLVGLINSGVGILPKDDNASVKVTPGSRASGHDHGGKGDGLIPPHGAGYNTPQNGVG